MQIFKMIVKIAFLGICVCILSVMLKGWLKEAVLPLQLSFAIITLAVVYDSIKELTEELIYYIGDSEIGTTVFAALLKGALICVVTKLACDIAYDSGNSTVANIIDLAGRIMLLSIGFPFVESVIKTAASFLP